MQLRLGWTAVLVVGGLCAASAAAAPKVDCEFGFDDVNFALGSHVVGDAPRTLQRVIYWLRADPSRRVLLQGSADATPHREPNGNRDLADRREAAVRTWLINEGVSGDRIELTQHRNQGESDDLDEKFGDRRVRIVPLYDPDAQDSASDCAEQIVDPYRDEVMERLASLESPAALIVTLPDPVDSHLSRDFDIFLSAVRNALNLVGYQLDRFEMTWPQLPSGGDETHQSSWASGSLKQDKAILTRYRRQPSVMIFRGDRTASEKKGPTDIVLFLVGETPTWGIQTRAFDRAFAFAKGLTEGDRTRMGVLGPTYSGSIESLFRGLKPYQGLTPSCHLIPVVSGAASNRRNKATILDLNGFDYEQLPVDTEDRLRILMQQLDLDGDCSKVTLLREASAFGAAKLAKGACKSATPPRVVTYPLHISELREAHEAGLDRRIPGMDDRLSKDLVFQVARLPLSLAESAMPDDRVPLFGRNLTPQTLDMMIAEVLRKVDLEGTVAVGIFGTNIRDKLFLAGEVAKHAGDVRLFTDEADVLLAHPRFSFATHGMLVASTNLLKYEESSKSAVFEFPSDAAHGVFRAALQLAAELGASSEAAIPSDHRPNRSKAIALGVVGRGRVIWTERRRVKGDDELILPGAERKRILWLLLLVVTAASVAFFWFRTASLDGDVATAFRALFVIVPVGLVAILYARPSLLQTLSNVVTPPTAALGGCALMSAVTAAHWSPSSRRIRNILVLVALVVSSSIAVIAWSEWAIEKPTNLDLGSGISIIPALWCLFAAVSLLLVVAMRWLASCTCSRGDSSSTSDGRSFRNLVSGSVGLALLSLVGAVLSFYLYRHGLKVQTIGQESAWNIFVALCFAVITQGAISSLWIGRRYGSPAITRSRQLRFGDRLPRDKEDFGSRPLRSALFTAPVCFLLLLLAVELYPFHPRNLIVSTSLVLTFGAIATVLWILMLRPGSDDPGVGSVADVFSVLKEEGLWVGLVTLVSLVSLLPHVRERFGGLLDFVTKIIG